VLVEKKVKSERKCYLCGGTKFKKRPGSVRDKPELGVLECTSCGLVFLSSFDHIRNGFYEDAGMHGKDIPKPSTILKDTERDDNRRFQYLKSLLPNRKLLDFGCGAGGFLLKARELAATVHGIEPEKRLGHHFQHLGLMIFKSLSDIPNDMRGGDMTS